MLTLAIMIKNESVAIRETLLPFLKGGVKNFFIFDSGSTDGTQKIVHELFRENAAVQYHLHEEPFVDFSTSRNRTLALAEQAFPDIPFIIMPDAEWHIKNIENLLAFCHQQHTSETPLFLINIVMNKTFSFFTARLFRTNAHIRFSGVVHEVPTMIAEAKVPSSIFFELNGTRDGVEKSKQRWKRDLALLLRAHKANPKEPRGLFYLAQTYECLNKLPQAYKFYKQRTTVNGFIEEDFITHLRLGRIAEALSKTNANYSWEQALSHYHQAFAIRPQRVEPLINIADHYWPSNIPLCYLYANYACSAPYPESDILFVDKHLYDYTRYEILSRCAWYQNDYVSGLKATKKALSIAPDTPHLISNLALYLKKTMEHDRIKIKDEQYET